MIYETKNNNEEIIKIYVIRIPKLYLILHKNVIQIFIRIRIF